MQLYFLTVILPHRIAQKENKYIQKIEIQSCELVHTYHLHYRDRMSKSINEYVTKFAIDSSLKNHQSVVNKGIN